jgi:DNA-binding response OmpR family regulator
MTAIAREQVVSGAEGWMLVVDDDATDRMILFRLLERDGHRATVANNGAAALELLRSEPFDVVLLDLLMPEPDGYAVLAQIKADQRLAAVPVIVISGVDDTADVARCLALGADDYLPKPIDPVLLRARVTASLERKRLRERQDEYLDILSEVAETLAAAGSDDFDPERLDPLVRRTDAVGRLARAVRDLGTRLGQP